MTSKTIQEKSGMDYVIGASEVADYAELLEKCRQRFAEPDANLLRLAFNYCIIAHEGQLRKSGVKYYTHPLSVAYILLDEIPLDMDSVVAALLHNVLDESDVYTYEDIKFTFGENIASIVYGVTRIKFVESQHIDRADQLDNYRRLLLTLFTDIRIILVKLADRLDNMRTLQYISSSSQVKFAKETLDIYSPFANRFGLTRIKFELEDLSFRYLQPEIYKNIEATIKGTHRSRTEYVNRFKEPIVIRLEQEGLLKKEGVRYKINGRAKNVFSIYNKTLIRNKSIDELYDIFAIRIILETDNPLFCYYVYGIVGEMYKPIPETFKDYISAPKPNGYRSLHTAVAGPDDRIVEVQIRTEQMHQASEVGVAAHFRYKNSVGASNIIDDAQIQTWLDEVRNIFDKIGRDDSGKLLSLVLQNRLADKIYVFTPQDEFKELPNGSTVLDFAFNIHTDLGLRCLGAKVNGKFRLVNHILNSGDKVEVLTSHKQEPEKKWLDYVVTSQATIKLINYFKRQRNLLLKQGKQLFVAKNIENNVRNISKQELISIIKQYNFDSREDFYISIGDGSLDLDAIYPIIIANIINKRQNKGINEDPNKMDTLSSQFFRHISSYADKNFSFAECCNPLPGDSIFGIEEFRREIEVHNSYCDKYKKLLNTHPKDIIILDWEHFMDRQFRAKLHITAEDKFTLMDKIINIVRNNDMNQIISVSYDSGNGMFDTTIEFSISNNSFINVIMNDIEDIIGIKSVERAS